MIRTAFVSDQPLTALGLRTLLNDCDVFDLVGEFTSKDNIVKGIQKLEPDILILDCYLLINPSEFIIREINKANLRIPIIALNQIIDEQHFLSLINAGIGGNLLTHEPLNVIHESIQDVAEGVFRISAELENIHPNQISSSEELLRDLTKREREVLTLVSAGYTNPQIAEKLHISMGTVKNHIKSLYKKLNVHTRVEVVLLCLKHGLVELM